MSAGSAHASTLGVRELLSDVLIVGGAVAVTFGCHDLAPPLGWIAGGALAWLIGWRIG